MDPVILARIQFALTVGFHYLFPPITFGLTLVILILETLYLRTNLERYKELSSFLIKILGLTFVMGTVTGITMEFSFGTNWSQYSRLVGDIFGAPLAAEGVFAFFLESGFLGVLLFARQRISKKAYWLAAFLVFFGAHLSGLWIIIANSWMQTPAGYTLQGSRAVLTDFFAAALNPSTLPRYLHAVVGGWITGAFLVAGIGAWYQLKGRHLESARWLMRVGLGVGLLATIVQAGIGHWHSVQVAQTQPEKLAAYEGLFDSKNGASLALFGIPDESNERVLFYIGVPKLLSFLINFDADSRVMGLREFPHDQWPPVMVPFMTYHLMILLGLFFIGFTLLGLFLLRRGRLESTRWFLLLMLWAIPLPHIANETGWIAAEVGRQPWAVYHVLQTADAVSVVVPAWQVLLTLVGFAIVYLLLSILYVGAVLRVVRRGPGEVAPAPALAYA
jgi:cytochrome d ubiquinol oxidase subunit I